jgi:hypothetical protein
MYASLLDQSIPVLDSLHATPTPKEHHNRLPRLQTAAVKIEKAPIKVKTCR